MVIIVRKRGRPIGHRLSEASKERIRQKRIGTSHTKETRDKISRSLREYFKKRDPLADSIEQEYSYISEEATDWIIDNSDYLNDTDCVMTEKRLSYLNQVEIAMGSDVENMFGHSATPEFFMLLKEEMKKLNCAPLDMDELYSLI